MWESINTILDGYKRELCSSDKTVELLESLSQKLLPDREHQFFDLLQSQLFSEPYSHLQSRRTVHDVVIRAWASFGPTERLPSVVFALLRFDDREEMESSARKIAPEFVHSLWTNRTRFSRPVLDVIRAHCALFTSDQSTPLTGTQFPSSLVEAASRLEKAVDKINFERFEQTLRNPQPSIVSGESLRGFSLFDLKLEILRVIAQSSPKAVNKYNLLGRPPAKGELELALGTTMGAAERNRAYEAFEELKKTGHIRPTYTDLNDPENWVIATEAGRRALKTGALDALDDTLCKIAPHLLKLRRGAWAGLNSGEPHSLEQAAHSARELIDQVLKIGAPDDDVRRQPWYSPDATSASGITRRMRLRFLVEKYAGELSETELRVAEKASDFVLAVDEKLKALAHSRVEPDAEEVEAAITSAEIALKSVLTSFRRSKQTAARGKI